MKKFIIMFALCVSAVIGASAQIATENSNLFDNVGVGVTAGVSTPLDFNSMFPLNPNVGLKITKDVTPVLGFQVEGLAIFNNNHFGNIKNGLKATNVGVNGVINLSNAFGGYKGTPRTFEISAVGGLGWIHYFNQSSLNEEYVYLPANGMTAKTGVDLAFNLGKKKAHSLVITPAVYWSLYRGGAVNFNKHNAQLALNLSYVYHFKTSNGTHHFKTYDVGAMQNEITALNARLDECRNRKPEVINNVIEKIVPCNTQWVVQFAQKSAELTSEAKAILDSIGENTVVDVIGTASPEGDKDFNQRLSEDRAKNVADYLTNRGVKVNSWSGKGVQIGEATNRLAIVTVKQ